MQLVSARRTSAVQEASTRGKGEQGCASRPVIHQKLPTRRACRRALRQGNVHTATALGETHGKRLSDAGSTPAISTKAKILSTTSAGFLLCIIHF